jgi:hypothetical protein
MSCPFKHEHENMFHGMTRKLMLRMRALRVTIDEKIQHGKRQARGSASIKRPLKLSALHDRLGQKLRRAFKKYSPNEQ